MKAFRDLSDGEIGVFGYYLSVFKGHVEISDKSGCKVTLPREYFDHLVDKYIGADAIRKYVAEHEKARERDGGYDAISRMAGAHT